MNTKTKHSVALCLVPAVTALLAACGGGSSGSAATATPSGTSTHTVNSKGVFSDGPVAGVSYTASPSGASGTTDAQGQFSFSAGDTVTFTAAGVSLGAATPTTAANGTATVTPLNLVPGATSVSDPTVTAIGQLLATLNSIAVKAGAGSSGTFTMPSASQAQAFISALDAQATQASQLAAALSSSSLATAASAAGIGITSAANAQSNLTQGINSAGYVGSVWTGTCTCGGGGYFYMQPDGTLTGFTDTGRLLSGTWGASAASAGGLNFTLASAGGGYSQNGTIAAGATTGTATIYNSSGVSQGVLTISEVASAATLTNPQYLGGWYATFTPNATGTANGQNSGGAYFIVSPDGKVYGISDGGNVFTGTWVPSTGIGTVTTSGSTVLTVGIDLPQANGTLSAGTTSYGSLALSRTGTLNLKTGSGSGTPIPLDLNVQVNWPTNVGNVVSSFALELTVNDSTGNPVANAVKSEVNAMGIGAQNWQMTDNIAASYPQGVGATYQLSVGPSNCSIVNPSGNVCTSSCSSASYPTVTVTCH